MKSDHLIWHAHVFGTTEETMKTQDLSTARSLSLFALLAIVGVGLSVFVANDCYASGATGGFVIQTDPANDTDDQQEESDSKSDSVSGKRSPTKEFSYHTYESMLAQLRQWEAAHPETCKVHDLGVSSDGTTHMWALKISDNVDQEEDEPSVLLTGAIHGNERPAPEMALHTIDFLLNNRSNRGLINKTQIWVIPIMNSAGHVANTRQNANRVDLNRGFPVDWTKDSLEGLEVEIKNLIVNFYNKRDHVVAGIDLHTYGQVYLLPYARTEGEPADYDALLSLGERMAQSANYRPMKLSKFIRRTVTGGGADYRYGKYGTFYYGLELGKSHHPPASKLRGICERNLRGVMMMMNRIHYSTLTGHITHQGKPIVATISVDGIDHEQNLRLPYQSDKNFGRYYRILLPGKYKVTFSFDGQEIVKKDIQIVGNQQTIVDIDFAFSK